MKIQDWRLIDRTQEFTLHDASCYWEGLFPSDYPEGSPEEKRILSRAEVIVNCLRESGKIAPPKRRINPRTGGVILSDFKLNEIFPRQFFEIAAEHLGEKPRFLCPGAPNRRAEPVMSASVQIIRCLCLKVGIDPDSVHAVAELRALLDIDLDYKTIAKYLGRK